MLVDFAQWVGWRNPFQIKLPSGGLRDVQYSSQVIEDIRAIWMSFDGSKNVDCQRLGGIKFMSIRLLIVPNVPGKDFPIGNRLVSRREEIGLNCGNDIGFHIDLVMHENSTMARKILETKSRLFDG